MIDGIIRAVEKFIKRERKKSRFRGQRQKKWILFKMEMIQVRGAR